jgi:hypothetical protein
VVRGLRDEDLARTAPFALFGGTAVSVRTLIERVLIGDPEQHRVVRNDGQVLLVSLIAGIDPVLSGTPTP